ncbi:DUF6207 family protein [Streptomyces sp. NPDC050161]|uniref:DUF6207 family protein n=1 Tax=Streptomyces sp. NPDC050161 TaxID=3365604 RepID=UPI003797E6C0
MIAIDRLLARALLVNDPQIPADAVPYEDTAYPALTPDGTPLWDSCGRDLTDDTAAKNLHALCEAAVSHSTPGQIADFITEQLPAPHGAWILGCLLQLAAAEDGARFWWQYAAGAGEPAASYCLYLHHLALGDSHAAAFWREQTGIGTQPNTDSTTPAGNDAPAYSLNIDIPTALRILSHLTPATGRGRTEAADAVMNYVVAAVTAGYARNPGYEIPLPGPHFAEHIEIILATTLSAPGSSRPREPSATALPNRPPLDLHADDRPQAYAQEPDRVLVEIAAVDDESASAFKEAIAACWKTATADLTIREMDHPGIRLRYYLDRRPHGATLQESRTRAVQPS